MRTVFKYLFPIEDEFELELPDGASIVMVGPIPALWAIVDTRSSLVKRNFCVRGTGHPIQPELSHVGSFHQAPFVWHLFERL